MGHRLFADGFWSVDRRHALRACGESTQDYRRRGHADFTEPNVSQYGAGRAHAGDSQPPQALRRRSRNCWDAAPFRRAGAIVGARNMRQAEGVVRARELHLNEIEAFAETAA